MLVLPGVTELGRRALDLEGWRDRSVWGWDARDGCLFAQLWPDVDDDDDEDDDPGEGPPAIWITPGPNWQATGLPQILASWIATATGKPEREVVLSMARGAPDVVARSLQGYAAVLEEREARVR